MQDDRSTNDVQGWTKKKFEEKQMQQGRRSRIRIDCR